MSKNAPTPKPSDHEDWEGLTDFSEEGELEEESLRRQLRFYKKAVAYTLIATGLVILIFLMSSLIPTKVFLGIICPISIALFIAAGLPHWMLSREKRKA